MGANEVGTDAVGVGAMLDGSLASSRVSSEGFGRGAELALGTPAGTSRMGLMSPSLSSSSSLLEDLESSP